MVCFSSVALYVVGHHKRKILRYRKENPMAWSGAGQFHPQKSVADAVAVDVDIVVASDIDGRSAEELIGRASLEELPKAKAAQEAAQEASDAAAATPGDAEAQAEIAETAKKAAIWWAARAIVYAKAAQAAAVKPGEQ